MDTQVANELINKFMENKNNYYGICWNSLMEVVERIESLTDPIHGGFTVTVSNTRCSIIADLFRPNESTAPEYYYTIQTETKIKSVFTAVIAFINWYNINIKKNINLIENH